MARSTTRTVTVTAEATVDSAAPKPTIELLDPGTLLVNLNVRHKARLDPAFLARIRGTASWSRSSPSGPPRAGCRSGSVTGAPSPRSMRAARSCPSS
jgi:hypothetical protein